MFQLIRLIMTTEYVIVIFLLTIGCGSLFAIATSLFRLHSFIYSASYVISQLRSDA